MPGFVGRNRVPIELTETIDGVEQTNIIYIRDKMGYGARSRVQGSAARNVSQNPDGTLNVDLNFGQANVTLLIENIVDWSGPQFTDERGKKIPVTPVKIEELDPGWDLIDMVLGKIQELNLVRGPNADELKNSMPVGSEPSNSGVPTGPLVAMTLR